ncbi:hypothetical protein ACFL4K_02830 [Candidatus Neomarinimicrobiota bacterium]
MPVGEYILMVTYLGFESLQIQLEVRLGDQIKVNYELMPKALEGEVIEVTGERTERQVNNQISRVKLGVRQLKSVPQIGEEDLLRTLQFLPGVLTAAGRSGNRWSEPEIFNIFSKVIRPVRL